MVRVRKLTDDGDFEYEGGRCVLIEDDEADAQAVSVILQTIQGENLYHPSLGLDLDVFSRVGRDGRIALLENLLLRTGRISRVISIEEKAPMGRRKNFQAVIRAQLASSREETEFLFSLG